MGTNTRTLSPLYDFFFRYVGAHQNSRSCGTGNTRPSCLTEFSQRCVVDGKMVALVTGTASGAHKVGKNVYTCSHGWILSRNHVFSPSVCVSRPQCATRSNVITHVGELWVANESIGMRHCSGSVTIGEVTQNLALWVGWCRYSPWCVVRVENRLFD